MALGGGTFITQNKVLPGSYINFVSTDTGVNVFGERGVGALGLFLDYGDKQVHCITKEDFQKDSLKLFGYDYNSSELMPVREFFRHGKTLIYKNLGSGVAATNEFATAKAYGTRGNDIKIVIQTNVDDESKFDVLTYMSTTLVDSQTVATAAELIGNDFVSFKTNATLAKTAGTALAGGKNDSATGGNVQSFLSQLESYTFNAVGIITEDSDWSDLLIEWTKRMRDEVGKKFQCVVFDCTTINYEGVVNTYCDVDNGKCENTVAWVVGALASCEINKSLTNAIYDGELDIICDYSQRMLEDCIRKGQFMFHKVDDEVRVLMDINSLTNFTPEKGAVFADNQTVRVCDQIANDIAAIFNNYYLGKVPNDDAGRSALWAQIVKHHNKLTELRAIEDFSSENITVEQGETKKSVVVTDCITPVNAMTQLYMTVVVQ